jgi:aspartyl-tRNA(Asn)/glutamyl-tRNA(Gln) amidotransferase subunit A
MTVREQGKLLRARKLSCVELIEQTLAKIKARAASHWFITVTEEQARAEAAERDKELAAGKDRGPFHGIPIALKDLFYTRGVRTTAGSLLFRDFVPDYDATVVARLREAGAISVGKTNLHELAYGITSKNPHYGAALNPLDPNRLPGGSSGGSAAAVAAGLVPMALGSDTGGSIRIPASFCGIAGLKPTYGRVSRHGVLPLAFSLDHVGPFGTCVDDCALAMNAMADGDFTLPLQPNLNEIRVGVPKNFFFDRVDEQVSAAVLNSVSEMKRLDASISEVQVPDLNEANAAARVIQYAEATALYVHQDNPALFGKDVWNLIQQGKTIAGHEYVNAQRVRTLFRRDFNAIWQNIDVLVAPATPITAPGVDEIEIQLGSQKENTRMASTRLVRAINLLGEPALSLPCGKASSGMPIGLQLIGPPFSEAKLLQIGSTLETCLNPREGGL